MFRCLQWAVGMLALLGCVTAGAASEPCVVLLHGLGRTACSMAILEARLQDHGYYVWNRSYASRHRPIERTAQVVGAGIAHCRARGFKRIHFVTHSLGGILVRQYFQDKQAPEVQRVVMLAPPNQGSEVTDRYRDRWWYRWATGPAGQQLGTGPDSIPNRLAPLAGLEIGVIAGVRRGLTGFSGVFDGAHDGKVSVASARLAEMRDFLAVDAPHASIMNTEEVAAQVMAFLEHGRFNPAWFALPAWFSDDDDGSTAW